MRPVLGSSDSRPKNGSSRIAALAILLGAAFLAVALGCGLFASATRIDATSRAREVRLVDNGLHLHTEEMRRGLAANTIWDDAVAHLDVKFDPQWAHDFIGQYFWQTDGFQLVYVLDGKGGPVFGYERGHTVDPGRFAPLAGQVAPLIAQIRAREAARGAWRPDDKAPSEAIGASIVARRGGQAFLLAASLVQTDHSTGARPSLRAPIVVVGEAFDDAFITRMSRRYLLDDLRIVAPAARSPAGYNVAQIRDASGNVALRLAWRPNSPISRLLSIAGPPLAMAFLALLLLAAGLIRHERRRNQALLSATIDARSASAAKSAFLAMMSHEIRTPLNGVLGMTQAMALEPLSEPQRARLDVVRQSGEALLAILNDVLDLSKIEAGKLELELIEFDLADVMQGAHAAFGALAAAKGLSFSLDISGAEGVYRGDPTRIRQILYNLISNALKFTAAGNIRVRAEAAPEGLRLIVSDTGEGIAPDKLGQLFGKFIQGDASTTRRFGGTGLGLSICRELAELMGGAIEARSTPGEGSTFVVTLRARKVGPPRDAVTLPSPSEPPTPWSEALRVLIAEDNPVNRLVVRTLLQQAGIEPTVVDDGALAVEAWDGGEWDVVLMDVQMPVMDGLAAVRQIRAREQASGRPRTPVIALTANAMIHQVSEYIAAGMDGHIAKPIEARALFETLARFLPDPPAGEPAPDELATPAGNGVARVA